MGFTDIHCHLIAGIDDGADSVEESLAMARMAVDDGVSTIICTPHQLGGFPANRGADIRQHVCQLQALLAQENIPLSLLPGADVRIEDDMIARLRSGDVVSLGDHRRHVLLELPHEMYFPLEPVLEQLASLGMTGIFSHPERNQGILRDPKLLAPLVRFGCLMQVTAGSLLGTFGERSKILAEWMIEHRLVHFMATDAHGCKARRPLLARAHRRVAELADARTADALCIHNPGTVAVGEELDFVRPAAVKTGFSRWFGRGVAA